MAKKYLDYDGLAHLITKIKTLVAGKADSGHTHSAATTSAAGFMSAADKTKLDGITASADTVSFSQSLTSGTKVGTITINGTGTDLYCQTNTNTDTKVNVTLGTTTKAYLLGTSTTPTSTATGVTAISDTGVYLDTTAGKLTATSFAGSGASLTSLNAGNVSSGTLAVARGGTGVTSNPSMLTNLGSTTAASVFATSPRPGVTGTLPIANGGTGSTTASAARTALGITPANIGAATSGHNHDSTYLNLAGGTLTGDVSIRKSGVAYESIIGSGTNNVLMRVRNSAGDSNNQRTIALFDSTQRPDIETAVRLYDVTDGSEEIYAIYGEHNITKGTTDLEAGVSALADGAIHFVYE